MLCFLKQQTLVDQRGPFTAPWSNHFIPLPNWCDIFHSQNQTNSLPINTGPIKTEVAWGFTLEQAEFTALCQHEEAPEDEPLTFIPFMIQGDEIYIEKNDTGQ